MKSFIVAFGLTMVIANLGSSGCAALQQQKLKPQREEVSQDQTMNEPSLLIVQFQIDGNGSPQDLNALIQIEDELAALFRTGDAATVDGHDLGSGSMNIFIQVEQWQHCVATLLSYLQSATWAGSATAAGRRADETYEVIWPRQFKGQFSID